MIASLLVSSSSLARQAQIVDFKGSAPRKGTIAHLDIGKFHGPDNWRLHMLIRVDNVPHHCYVVSKDLQKLVALHKLVRDGIKDKDDATTTCFVEQIQADVTSYTSDLDKDPSAFGYGSNIL
ncbi:MAG TPA: hypothetical protein VE954_14275 [Oligoflexus sp.]|uniref:hypothetical protein n=1 Tax=Oligoflexus sp. TaxID=1971216 RepID=UPI002D6F186F|nr:hypothetical protein [Oligoflexus sp.]HYX34265.1 hypothetical protein [Oligoflexus sp.]